MVIFNKGDRVQISAKEPTSVDEWGRISSTGTVESNIPDQNGEILVHADGLLAMISVLPTELTKI